MSGSVFDDLLVYYDSIFSLYGYWIILSNVSMRGCYVVVECFVINYMEVKMVALLCSIFGLHES